MSFLGQIENRLPALGELGGQFDVLGAQHCDEYRDTFAHRRIYELERFAESGALVGGQRDLIVLTPVLNPLTAPHLAADFDHLASAGNRSVVGHTVETLDHLRTGRTQAEGESAVGDVIETSRGHRGQGGRSGVELQNARSQLDALRAGRQITKGADRIERVRLRNEHDVQPGAFEVGDFSGHLFEPARVIDCQPDSHGECLRAGELLSKFGGLLLDAAELGAHRLGQGCCTGQRSHRHHQVVDQAVVVEVQEVAAGESHTGHAGDSGLEDERVVTAVAVGDFPHVAEVFEDAQHAAQNRRRNRLARVGLKATGLVKTTVSASSAWMAASSRSSPLYGTGA